MKDQNHRKLALQAFGEYKQKTIMIESIGLSIQELIQVSKGGAGPFTYILRLDKTQTLPSKIEAIPHRDDPDMILYIGGSNSNQKVVRPKSLIDSCNSAIAIFNREGFAISDQKYGHTVANALTTSLMENGFSLKHCLLDIIDGGGKYNELEFIIGYQESYFQLPPWNGSRGGASAYLKQSLTEEIATGL